MVKRILLGLIMMALMLMLVACHRDNNSTSDTTEEIEESTNPINDEEDEEEEKVGYEKSFKVLAIGNSFSQDAMAYLYNIAKDYGVEEVVIANLYIPGASLQTQWSVASGNRNSYEYQKNSTGIWMTEKNTSLLTALADEAWDIITFQQASGYSGQVETIEPYLSNLLEYVKSNLPHSDVKLVWHMTWAYQSDSTHQHFHHYDHDQIRMYDAIVDVVKTKILTYEDFATIIPAGTAIQNARTSYLGDTLTRDGYHLSLIHGRYIAGLTWFKALTGFSIDDISYMPSGISSEELTLIREAVNNAIVEPYAITPSQYSIDNVDLSQHRQITFELTHGYWDARKQGDEHTLHTDEPDSKNYLTQSKRFTREELPIGTVILLEDGYQYQVNFWYSDNSIFAINGQAGPTTRPVLILDEEWWSNYKYVAFNISSTQVGESLEGQTEQVLEKFRIYVPNN